MIRGSINYRIARFIAKKMCRDVDEMKRLAKELNISFSNMLSRLSYLKSRGYIKVYRVRMKGRMVTRYCKGEDVF